MIVDRPYTWIEVTAWGEDPTFIVNEYGGAIVTFPMRRSYVVELWSDWEWLG